MAEKVSGNVKYLLLPIRTNPGSDGFAPAEAETIVQDYLSKGFTIVASQITNITKDGMDVAHVLVK